MGSLLVSLCAFGVAFAGDPVSLAIAVHRDAGGIGDVRAEGAGGPCVRAGFEIQCPADGPVTFRWEGAPGWELTGDTVLEPGGSGAAAVWAAADQRRDDEAALAGAVTAEVVRDLFVRRGDHPVRAPSLASWQALLALAEHPDADVRREVVDAIAPYWRHTESDPFPRGAPEVVPPRVVERLAADPDRRVRRRLASRLADVQARGTPLEAAANDALLAIATGEGPPRAGFAAVAVRARRGESPGLDAWGAAMAAVEQPGPAGRAAANAMAALATELTVAQVDPREAMDKAARFQLERVWHIWKAWRADVPFEPVLAERLLRDTIGASPVLFRAWAASDPDGLAAVLRRWEPAAPHTDRYRWLVLSLTGPIPEALRPLVADTLSAEGGGAGAE